LFEESIRLDILNVFFLDITVPLPFTSKKFYHLSASVTINGVKLDIRDWAASKRFRHDHHINRKTVTLLAAKTFT